MNTKQLATSIALAIAMVALTHTTDVRATSSVGDPNVAVTLSSCGTDPTLVIGSDSRSGTVIIGSGATGCTVTNGNAAHEASGGHDGATLHFQHCVMSAWTTSEGSGSYTANKNGIVVSGLGAGRAFSWVCL